MKSRNFKLRTLNSPADEQAKIRRGPEQRVGMHPIVESAEPSTFGQESQFKQFFNMFKSLIGKDKSSRVRNEANYSQNIQPRHRQIIIEPPEPVNNKVDSRQLKKWITSVMKTVTSASFNYYSRNEMSFNQAKIFCSQNIFKNVAILNQKYSLSAKELEMIDKHIQKGVLSYLKTIYPLTDNNEVNKKLQEMIHEVDNIEALPNNYLASATNVVFEYRDDGNYNDLIMRLINELVQYLDVETVDEETNFIDFQGFMTSVFEKVMDEDWMRKNDKEVLASHLKLMHQKSDIGVGGASPHKLEMKKQENENIEEFKERLRKRNEEKEKYRASVKDYTHYIIGRKFPEHTVTYTEKEIQSRNMTIKNPNILRILTKWCEQLWQKYSQVGYFSSRSESIKVLKGGNVNSLLHWMRGFLDEKLVTEKEEIKKFMKKLTDKNYEMQSKILKMELFEGSSDYVEEVEKTCGKFSFKVVKNLHSYIIAYLNKLIHGLMRVSKEFYESNILSQYSYWPSAPNLLTFKIGDIMRCKCTSKQKEIIRIYKQIERISKQNPEKLKIVRIKNRLKGGTNDILINIKFNNKFLCQIQLAVKAYSTDFIKCSNNFQHYLYELQRSYFGPLTQLCSIWNTLDPRTAIYQQLIEQQHKFYHKIEHICKTLNKKIIMKEYKRPFICSECNLAFFHNNYLKHHTKCSNCQYFLCANCYIESKSEAQVIEELIEDKKLKHATLRKLSKTDPYPQFGCCIFLQAKVPKVQFFHYLNYDKNSLDYLFGKKDGQLYQVQNIKTAKASKQFRRRHIIFSVDDYNSEEMIVIDPQEIRLYILTQIMKTNYKKYKESLSLMGQDLSTEACRQILAVGTKSQKENVKNLFLTDNKLTSLPFNIEEFPNLRWLTLSRNVAQIEGLQQLRNLKNLIWVQGQLTEIPDTIYKSISLREICLSSNYITVIEPLISNLKYLKILELDDNQISVLPDEIGMCKGLTELKLEQNQLSQLPHSLFNLTNLQILLLSENRLTSLSEEIKQLTKLKSLSIGSNYDINELPQSLYSLKFLEILKIEGTTVSRLSENISNWQNLKKFNFSRTKILALPHQMKNLKKLQKLTMSSVAGIQIGSAFQGLKGLINLDFGSNGCYDLPIQLKDLQALQVLNVQSNSLQTINREIFEKSSKLTTLKANLNSFTIFPNLNFLQNLAHLNLSNNNISQIPQDFLCEDSVLQQFHMDENKLKCLPYSFKDLSKLQYLHLNSNELTELIDKKYEEQLNNMEEGIWPKLISLQIKANRFTELPKYICKSTNIMDLFISSNQLTSLPSELGLITKLKQIQANYNELTSIPIELISCKNLFGIYFSCNKFKCVQDFIQHIPNLKTCYFDYNEIQTIQCIEWILINKKKMVLGTLPDIAYKLKYGRDRIQDQQTPLDENFDVLENAEAEAQVQVTNEQQAGLQAQINNLVPQQQQQGIQNVSLI